MSQTTLNRCRLILAMPLLDDAVSSLTHALEGGDVASVIITANGMDEQKFLHLCKKLVRLSQNYDVAAIVAGDTRIAGRSEADGYLVENGTEGLKDALARFSPQKIVGCGAIRGRHRALEAGELGPDFVFFGALDKDIRAEPHKKNLDLAHWWTQIVEIPCAVMGGNTLESAIDVAMSAAEFVVLSRAVFTHEGGPGKAVGKVNELLDEFGPKFDEQ